MAHNNSRVFVHPQVFLAAAIALMIVPLQWMTAWFAAAAIHELGHVLAVYLCGRKIDSIEISIHGAVIQAQPLKALESVICSLAGPICGGMLILLSGYFPRLALCALVQMAYNLLPIYPLDGGRAYSALLNLLFRQQTAAQILSITQLIILSVLAGFCIYISLVMHLGCMPLLFAAVLLAKNRKIKIPCKRSLHRVQ